MTNGDKVRLMSDEELVDFTYGDAYKGSPWCTPLNARCKHEHEDYTCESCMLDWLKEEANE